ncbi:conserved protein of unknown function [Rhodovastum atsumiense]|uniref:Uncharacterized protein n=1 Tax=Rhodovastum atsumiense TaxID=504468 RepID=A0A5M6ISM7_9PROT|nr:hypothetical protein [Rhodovastum atsumiense]KAA5611324.1 hypothetical protein F1189_15365 [Rhodovastum atsumiense]CAH2601801.1 conserved protein of unknown function [Rhodovastum atsumiense]
MTLERTCAESTPDAIEAARLRHAADDAADPQTRALLLKLAAANEAAARDGHVAAAANQNDAAEPAGLLRRAWSRLAEKRSGQVAARRLRDDRAAMIRTGG